MEKISDIEDYLGGSDAVMRGLIAKYGSCDILLTEREAFDSLMKAVISQQLSNKASNSITERVIAIHGSRPFKPQRILQIQNEDIRACGVSNNKIKTIKILAEAFTSKKITKNKLIKLNENELLQLLTSYWGIGKWTAQIFMMFCLQKLDALAENDAGLIRSHKILYPQSKSLEVTAKKWSPYRAVGAWYLWKYLDDLESDAQIS